MKIYTRKGDAGKTSLIGGTRVDKDHVRIEAYGTVDELNSWIGVVRDLAPQKFEQDLVKIQNELFTIGSQLAADPEKNKMELPNISQQEIEWLEQQMDTMETKLPEMKNFVLPGGHSLVSNTHVARCICRRAERRTVELNDDFEVSDVILTYLNRLSDYLFVISRLFSIEVNAKEIPWKPRG